MTSSTTLTSIFEYNNKYNIHPFFFKFPKYLIFNINNKYIIIHCIKFIIFQLNLLFLEFLEFIAADQFLTTAADVHV